MPVYPTVVAIATPPGQGGIAVVRLSGPEAPEIAARVFTPRQQGRSVKNAKGYTAMFGDFLADGRPLDEGVALFFRAPHSYTGEDVVELSCHGGEQVTRSLLQACLAAGAAPAGPGEFTKRAVLNGRMNLTQAEAVLDMIEATSRQGVAMAKQALEGGIYQYIQPLKQQLIELAGHLAAYIDYPEEGVEDLTPETFLRQVNAACGQLEAVLRATKNGQVVKRGVQAAIVGSPNVGKSTLFNLLSGGERAIVTHVAGTTRDILREQINLGEITLQLADTAGLHQTQDIVEAEGIRRSYAELETASLVLAVLDGTRPLTGEDMALARACAGKTAICIVNKSDLGVQLDCAPLQEYFAEVLVLSAKQPESIALLQDAVQRVLKISAVDVDAPVLGSDRQLAAAAQSLEALGMAAKTVENGLTLDAAGLYLQESIEALSGLTGENTPDAIIEDVFTRFCVGK